MFHDPHNRPEEGSRLSSSITPAQSAFKDQLPMICDLLFTEEEPRLALQLFQALERIEPNPAEYAPVLSALLNHPGPELRIRSARALGRLTDAETDVLPVLFTALQRERNEEARLAIKQAIEAMPVPEYLELSRFYEDLRFSAYAKKADLRDYSNGKGLRPDQIHRALIQLHLDSEPEVRQFASACIYQAIPAMDARQKNGLLLSAAYALSEPGKADSYVICNLLYAVERLGSPAESVVPLLRRLYDNRDGTIATGAALTVLCFRPADPAAVELLLGALGNRRSTEIVIDPPVPTEPKDEPLDFGPFYRFIEKVAGGPVDTSELEALEYSMFEARHHILDVYERQIEELAERMRRASRELSDLSREILMIKVANRLDRLSPESSQKLLEGLLDVLGDPDEPLRVRKAVAAYTAFNRTGNSTMLDRFLKIAVEEGEPPELRARLCRSLVHLEYLNEREFARTEFELESLALDEPDPLVQGEAELALKNMRFFRSKPEARYSFLFDANGNLLPAIKARLRDMISPD